jgi:hypothetical protein
MLCSQAVCQDIARFSARKNQTELALLDAEASCRLPPTRPLPRQVSVSRLTKLSQVWQWPLANKNESRPRIDMSAEAPVSTPAALECVLRSGMSHKCKVHGVTCLQEFRRRDWDTWTEFWEWTTPAIKATWSLSRYPVYYWQGIRLNMSLCLIN